MSDERIPLDGKRGIRSLLEWAGVQNQGSIASVKVTAKWDDTVWVEVTHIARIKPEDVRDA